MYGFPVQFFFCFVFFENSDNPCHKLVPKGKKISKHLLSPPTPPTPPISKLFSCKPAEKNIDAGGMGGVQKREFLSQMIVLPQLMARIVEFLVRIFKCLEFS